MGTAIVGGDDARRHVRQEDVEVAAGHPCQPARGELGQREDRLEGRPACPRRGEVRWKRGRTAHATFSTSGPGARTGPTEVRRGSSRMARTPTNAMAAAPTPSQKTDPIANEIAS